MEIKPSADIRNNYNGIIDLCRKTGEPVFLTKNGNGDSVVMDIDTYNQRESSLRLRESLIAAKEARERGFKGYPAEEVVAEMKALIEEVTGSE